MHNTYTIKKIDKDILILNDGSTFRVDQFSTSRLPFWNAPFDKITVEKAGFHYTVTNVTKSESVKAEKIS